MTSRSVVTRQKQATAQQHYATTAADQEQAEYRAASAFLQQQDTTVSKKNKLTPAMRTCLMDLQASLTCPLCSQVLVQPVSLPCAHTFCCTCIDGHVDNSWNCPSTYEPLLKHDRSIDRTAVPFADSCCFAPRLIIHSKNLQHARVDEKCAPGKVSQH